MSVGSERENAPIGNEPALSQFGRARLSRLSSLRSRTRACSQPPGQPGLLICAPWAAGMRSSALKARATMWAERSTFRMRTNQISKTSVGRARRQLFQIAAGAKPKDNAGSATVKMR
jgi:hypothetical protein